MSDTMDHSTMMEKARSVAVEGTAPVRASKLPKFIRFPLLVTLSMALSTLLFSQAAEYVDPNLARVSRNLSEWWEVGALVAWRM